MNNKNGAPTTLEQAKQALEKTNADKYPKLYEAREANVKYLENYEQQKSRAAQAETKAKKKYAKGSKTPKKQEEGFDYAEKAYMKVNDILPDEYELVQKIMDDTGKSLDEVLESKYFRAEQKEHRESKASEDAIPDGGKRGGKSAKDSVDYWIAKGEMPPNTPENQQIRREYVNARLKKETDTSKFSNNPVVK